MHLGRVFRCILPAQVTKKKRLVTIRDLSRDFQHLTSGPKQFHTTNALGHLYLTRWSSNTTKQAHNRIKQATLDRALLIYKRIAKLAENENDNVAFKAFQGILKIVKEGRCPSINAIDDTLGNAPYAIKERSMNKNYIEL